jgi:serine phosphatase RsbU (regulator of sigma subunit)
VADDYTLDDVARTSDDAAVRARFDQATLTALRALSILFIFVALPHIAQASTPFRRGLGWASLALSVLMVIAARKRGTNRLARFVQGRARGSAMTFLISQAALLIFYNASAGNEAAVVFGVMAPMVALWFRLLPAEHVLLHASLAAIPAVALLSMPTQRLVASMIIPPAMVSGMMLGLALFISSRMRRSIVAEWGQRRASAREQIRMRDELRYARELQLSMLPECAPRLAWADICSISMPAAEVGGDYYDYFVDEDRVALVCGDVAGHGMASGLVLSALRGGLTLLRDTLDRPAVVLRRLHDVVTQTSRRRMLVTATLVLIDRASRSVTIASAGHPPVIVRHADGTVETIDLYAPPLGVRLPVNIPQRRFDWTPGDVFILHSDGIYETRNARDEVYGLDRLQRIVKERGDASAEELRDAILQDVAAFRGAGEQDDDVTIVICKMLA